MKKDKEDLDVGALLIGMGSPEEEMGGEEEGGGEDASPEEIAAEAMGAFKEALSGDDVGEQVRAFRTLMDACRMYDEE